MINRVSSIIMEYIHKQWYEIIKESKLLALGWFIAW